MSAVIAPLQLLLLVVAALALCGFVLRRSPASWTIFPIISTGLFFAFSWGESGGRATLMTLAIVLPLAVALYLLRGHPLWAAGLTFAVLFALDLSGTGTKGAQVIVGFSYLLFRLHDAILRGNRQPGTLLLQVFAFPVRSAGPIIMRGEHRTNPRHFSLRSAFYRRGVLLLALGLVKLFIVLPAVQHHFETGILFPLQPSVAAVRSVVATGLYQYARLYLDFSAYSDIAVGACALVGLRIRHNFRRPLLAVSVSDFWRRWHVTLSFWVRRHVYIPLGGSRGGRARTAFNLLLAMLLIGLWHGLSLPFIAWGLLHGGMLAAERFAIVPLLQRLGYLDARPVVVVRWFITQSFVALSWTVFFLGYGK